MLLCLLGVTWRLWLNESDVPEVPLCLAASISFLGDGLAILLIASVLTTIVSAKRRPVAWWLLSFSLAGLIYLDQHRLQPWAYQTLIYAILFATLPYRYAMRAMLPVAISVYIYSAAGKFDYQFMHTVGIDFLNVILQPIGGLQAKPEQLAKFTILFPLVELSLGLLLIPKRTRRVAGVGVMLMHVGLIVILGPFGLNHSLGVLTWNLLLVIQAWFLFVKGPSVSIQSLLVLARRFLVRQKAPCVQRALAICVSGICFAAVTMPLFERFGYWDHWTSWALYSPHNSRVEAQLHPIGIEKLPESILPFVGTDSDGDGRLDIDLGGWVLSQRAVPIYPQARYQLALLAELTDQHQIDKEIRCTVKSAADRWSGKRELKNLFGAEEIREHLRTFWLVP